MVATYTAGRRLKIGTGWREPGEPVPEAHDWFRREEWVHAGYLHETETSEADFRAALAKYKVGNVDHILDLVQLHDEHEVQLRGRGTPYVVALKTPPADSKAKKKP